MLGKVCLKRLRFVLYAVLFFLLTLDITNRTGDGLIATVCIWLALPNWSKMRSMPGRRRSRWRFKTAA